jgi:hypothetical protein
MKIKGRITILVDAKGARIEIEDEKASVQFLRINLTAEQFTACLGRLAMVPCEMHINGIEKVGKQHENTSFEFAISEAEYKNRNEVVLQAAAQSQLKDGWIADSYFGSQGSFFKKGDQWFARVTIRRWL